MFDPTVFDNLKVVLEGAVYDLDLEGYIEVNSRNDLVNLADMSRCWNIGFQETGLQEGAAAEIELSIVADQLQAEWKKTTSYAGCRLRIHYTLPAAADENGMAVLTAIREIWGADAIVESEVSFDPFASQKMHRQTFTLSFSTMITEEHAGDLERLAESVFQTLKRINDEKGAGI
ncbi:MULTISPECIES: hypothetical protein [Bacillaceae]|uniref:Uncharacterized protein n=1 Tax=Metabacillus sediminis TaxID=3117746 RepID=A0ABZ2NBX8_9BACI|nr:hypothetical protein [Bacillus sp. SJS]KZZ84217.1 hypothetical protein AS29_011670 [Bacillus sp. SJS]